MFGRSLCFILILFPVVLPITQAFAILPDTMLLEEKQLKRCDITELESGVYNPARITIEYHPEIKFNTEAIGRNDELISKVDASRVEGEVYPDGTVTNSLYNVATNRTEHFVFKWEFQTGATPTNPKTINFRYISQDNVQVAIDSPKIITDIYCKIVSIKIFERPFIQTQEELAREIEEFHAVRFDDIKTTDLKQTDLLTILVFVISIGFAIFGVVIFIIFYSSRTNTNELRVAVSNLKKAVGLQINQVEANENSIRNMKDIVDLMPKIVLGEMRKIAEDFLVLMAGETKKKIDEGSKKLVKEQEVKTEIEKITELAKDGLKKIAGQFIDIDGKKPSSKEDELREKFWKNTEVENRELYKEMFARFEESLKDGIDDQELRYEMKILDDVTREQILKREVKFDD